jgi:GT2 family glycosyltransferase
MRKNFEINDEDTIICLNNDITLRTGLCLHEILDTDVYVGSFVDGEGNFTYGLRCGYSKCLPLFFRKNFTGPCTFNMNFVAFKYTILKQYGFLDKRYSHGFGDYDLGLHLSFQGIIFRQSSLPIGVCERNKESGTSRDKRLSLIKRFQLFHSVKECPFWEHLYFLQKNSKIFWPIVLFYRYLRIVI